MKYIIHLDGLRALAILTVVLFHYFPEIVPGGFIGVDIFLVLSGYIITKVYYPKVASNTFSLSSFYLKRIKRILPPILFLSFVTIFFSFVFFDDKSFIKLLESIIASNLLFSNIYFYKVSGYFQTASSFQPMLHMWSLSLEEQFYVFWPLILLFGYKYKNIKLTIPLCILSSLCFCIYYSFHSPVGAYLLPHNRFWELAIGGFLAINEGALKSFLMRSLHKKHFHPFMDVFFIFLILTSCFFINKSSLFPFPNAFFPIAFATYFILFGDSNSFISKLISSKPMLALGKISYSLYIWHWPVYSIHQNLFHRPPNLTEKLILLCFSFCFSILSYRILEIPAKEISKRLELKRYIINTVVAVFTLLVLVTFFKRTEKRNDYSQFVFNNFVATLGTNTTIAQILSEIDILKNIESHKESILPKARANATSCKNIGASINVDRFCRIYNAESLSKDYLLVWGDSIAHMWSEIFAELSKELNQPIIYITHAGCPPLIGVRRTDNGFSSSYCNDGKLQKDILAFLENKSIKISFLIARWNLYIKGHILNKKIVGNSFIHSIERTNRFSPENAFVDFKFSLKETLKILNKHSRVIVFEDNPLLYLPLLEGLSSGEKYYPSKAEFNQFEMNIFNYLNKIAKENSAVDTFNLSQKLCNPECTGIQNNKPLYRDEVHLSYWGTLLFKEKLVNIIKEF